VLQCSEEELTRLVSTMSDGWKFEQVGNFFMLRNILTNFVIILLYGWVVDHLLIWKYADWYSVNIYFKCRIFKLPFCKWIYTASIEVLVCVFVCIPTICMTNNFTLYSISYHTVVPDPNKIYFLPFSLSTLDRPITTEMRIMQSFCASYQRNVLMFWCTALV
jgi:hypothetical protein